MTKLFCLLRYLHANKEEIPTQKAADPVQLIERRIYLIRGKKVIVDADLAQLYGVQTEVFNQAVKRNRERFPEDFMFQLTNKEAGSLRSQFVTSNSARGGRRYLPFVFTEQGVALLLTVLSSKRAIEVNIAIMRAFVKLREILESNEELNRKFAAVIRKLSLHDKYFKVVFDELKKLTAEPPPINRSITPFLRQSQTTQTRFWQRTGCLSSRFESCVWLGSSIRHTVLLITQSNPTRSFPQRSIPRCPGRRLDCGAAFAWTTIKSEPLRPTGSLRRAKFRKGASAQGPWPSPRGWAALGLDLKDRLLATW